MVLLTQVFRNTSKRKLSQQFIDSLRIYVKGGTGNRIKGSRVLSKLKFKLNGLNRFDKYYLVLIRSMLG